MAEERPQISRFPPFGPNGLFPNPAEDETLRTLTSQQQMTDQRGLTGLLKSTSVTYHEQPLILRRGRSISPAVGRGRSVSPAHPSVVNSSALATVHYEQSHTATLDMSMEGLSNSLLKKSIVTPQPNSVQPSQQQVLRERDTFSEVTGSVNSPLNTRPWTSGGDGQRKVSIANNSILTRDEKKAVSRPASSGGQPRFAQAREKDTRDFQQHMYEKRRPKSGDPYLPMDETMIDALRREFANPADIFKRPTISPSHNKGFLAENTDRRPLLISSAARRSAARRMRQQERINLLNFDPAKISPKDRAALQLGRLVMTTVFDQPELTSSDNISRFFVDSWLARNGSKAGKADALSIELMCGLQKAMNEHRYDTPYRHISNTPYQHTL